MKLYLARHGEAAIPPDGDERSLTERGQQEVSNLAVFLKSNQVTVKQVLHSGKLRAEQTANILAAAIAPETELVVCEGLMPDDPIDQIAYNIASFQHDTLLVGHLPFMGHLLSHLVLGQENPEIMPLHPSCFICLERVSAMRWALLWSVQPHLLPLG